MGPYPDGVWETTAGVTDDEARMDWPVLRDAPGWQRVVTGPSGWTWTWRAFPRFPGAPFRQIDLDDGGVTVESP